jgi:hypothetical protein
MEAGVPHFISLELTGRRFSQASNLDSVTSEMENQPFGGLSLRLHQDQLHE